MRLRRIWLIMVLTIGAVMMSGKVAQADWTYTVKRGDSLFSIARKTGVPLNTLRQRNGLSWNPLRLGQRLTIPSTGGVARGGAPVRSTGDVNLLAHAIHGEAGAEPYVGKVAVGGVILNRIQSSKFPKTLAGVIYQPHAFESVSNGIINRSPSSESRKAAQDAINGWDPSGGAIYFFNPAKTNNRWIWARRIINHIGKHVFAI
ncbi:LysM domain-containing protein [Hydrogenispora ethanolica]|uniref:LysM domain-containing protein n=1 Tax=Hydrogenispora ethanolica TaxID=1082276 RepID=A0A4R1SA49_HYDET|nr:cell wall hydrolase [Hydrogenispora ethanolica]TCL76308.1 LysM domain-containing protein [Hydrogenispora ethanolica]